MLDLIQLRPYDEFNRKLEANVHPPDWTNPKPSGRYNLVVIGAGTAGLVTAAGAAGLGAKVALIERELLEGIVSMLAASRPKVSSAPRSERPRSGMPEISASRCHREWKSTLRR
jgi:cation diffusion facilitator CzcD-associated flavoprotein CzcO